MPILVTTSPAQTQKTHSYNWHAAHLLDTPAFGTAGTKASPSVLSSLSSMFMCVSGVGAEDQYPAHYMPSNFLTVPAHEDGLLSVISIKLLKVRAT